MANGKIKTSTAGNKKKATGNWANELKKLGPVEFAAFEGMTIESDAYLRGAASPATNGALLKNQVLEGNSSGRSFRGKRQPLQSRKVCQDDVSGVQALWKL